MPYILTSANPEIKKDKDLVRMALTHEFPSTYLGKYITKKDAHLCNDYSCLMSTVSIQPFILQYANDELKNDRKLVMTAIAGNFRAIGHASKTLQTDPSVVIFAMEVAMEENKKRERYVSELHPCFAEMNRILCVLCKNLAESGAPVLRQMLRKEGKCRQCLMKEKVPVNDFLVSVLLRSKLETLWLVSRLSNLSHWSGCQGVQRSIIEYADLTHGLDACKDVVIYDTVVKLLLANELRLRGSSPRFSKCHELELRMMGLPLDCCGYAYKIYS